MMKRLAIPLAATLACLPVPATAANPSTLGCVGLTIGQEAMRALGENALQRNDGEQVGPMDRELEEVARATDACRRRYGWSDRAATAAGMWTLTSARLDAAAAALEQDGIAPMQAGEIVGRLGPRERDGLVGEPIDPSALNALRQLVEDAGLPTQGVVANHFVWFTIMLIQEDRQRAEFGAS